MNRNEAEMTLRNVFGLDHFQDSQWEAIDLLFQGERVLLIEKTGFGKSLCFQFPASVFDGITIVFSPLIALMRDQVRGLHQKGIKAGFINSEQSAEQNDRTTRNALAGRIKILYIAPERQENQEWIDATRRMKIAMVVIDEAHTISVWGHDFRPAFRRIVNLVRLLPIELPVLATTATATPRVQKDIEKQISGKITSIRGNLIRENFSLYVIKVSDEDQKLKWLGENLSHLEGTGIIYSGTRINTEVYARWICYLGIPAVEYNAGLDATSRKAIEIGLMHNKWKAIVSTNALGMGIDKPDIRFIIHTQIPASPIHYYQEIGRAGRDGKPTKIILFYNGSKDKKGVPKDYKLPKTFIDNGRPSLITYYKIIEILKKEQLGERELMKAANLKLTQVRIIKADLMEQQIIKEVRIGRMKKYEYQYKAPAFNPSPYKELRRQKLSELDAMISYVYLTSSRMKFLCDYLGDNSQRVYTNCDNTGCTPFKITGNKRMHKKLTEFRESFFPDLLVESNSSKLTNGVASGYSGFSGVGEAVYRCKYEGGGDFPNFLLKGTLKAFRKKFGREHFDLLLYVPPTESGPLVKNFAERLSAVLNIPISHALCKTGTTQPQKALKNGFLKKENVLCKFGYENPKEIQGKHLLLVDDIFDSGATIKEIGTMLTKLGAAKIAPLVIARTIGGDL